MECFEFGLSTAAAVASAPPKRRVIKCLFDGYHGSWLPDTHGEEMTWWFMQQHLL